MHNPSDDYRWLLSDEGFPQLEILRLNAADISDDTLIMGKGRMRNLKRLELLNCENVSYAAVKHFMEGRDKNFVVLIDASPSITQEDLNARPTDDVHNLPILKDNDSEGNPKRVYGFDVPMFHYLKLKLVPSYRELP